MAIDVALIALFTWLWVAAVRGRHGLRYLHPVAFLSLAALADVLIEGKREVVPPRQVARNVDGYLADLRASRKRDVQVALIVLCVWPLLTARPPLPLLAPATRKRFLEKRFLEEDAVPASRAALRPRADPHRVADGVSRLLRRPRLVGVDRLHAVPATPRRPAAAAGRPSPSAVVLTEAAAARALRHRGRRLGRGGRDPRRTASPRPVGEVLVVERGPHVDPRDFGDDEVTQYLRLYNEGALQLATDFELQVLQGVCVGGGTTINNALCMAPARAGARGVGEARARPRRAEGGDRGGSAGARGRRDSAARSTTCAADRFERAIRRPRTCGLRLRAHGGEHLRPLPGHRLLQHRLRLRGEADGARRGAAAGTDAGTGVEVLPDVEVERIDRAGDRAPRIVGDARVRRAGGDRGRRDRRRRGRDRLQRGCCSAAASAATPSAKG